MKHMARSSGLSVSTDGTGFVAHSGSIALALLANRAGLAKKLSKVTARSLGHRLAAVAAPNSRAIPRSVIGL